jgi:hypothetical protein
MLGIIEFFLSLPLQLLKFGLKESVLNVSAENAIEFRFSAWDYYRLVHIALNVEVQMILMITVTPLNGEHMCISH